MLGRWSLQNRLRCCRHDGIRTSLTAWEVNDDGWHIDPGLVPAFVGETGPYLSTQPSDQIVREYKNALKSIADNASAHSALGVRMEVQAVASRVLGIENSPILPHEHVVGEEFIFLMAAKHRPRMSDARSCTPG